ncbi:MAG: hypothetical protein AAGU75_00015 [Bacillota bacterium]
MDFRHVTIPIAPKAYAKLEKEASKKGLTVEELLFEYHNTSKYHVLPWWFFILTPFLTGILINIFYVLR